MRKEGWEGCEVVLHLVFTVTRFNNENLQNGAALSPHTTSKWKLSVHDGVKVQNEQGADVLVCSNELPRTVVGDDYTNTVGLGT